MSVNQESYPTVSRHAIDKYCKLTGCKNRKKARNRLLKLFRRAKRCKLPNGYHIERIINNNYVTANYFAVGRFRFVLVDGEMVTFEDKY